ncbi:MAG: response regulator [Anaerolineae bacterium]|nr:response regulator [Anaerolineae bacterium]
MSSPTVLIAEDESIVALDLDRKLSRLGYRVVGRTARSDDVIREARRLKPDVILMDIRLDGESDGIEAAAAIRAFSNVPIVFVTAYADERTLQRVLKVGPYGYIIKPFDDRELRTAIEVALYKYSLDARLYSQKAQFESILQTLSEGVVLVDSEHRIVFANSHAKRFLQVLADVDAEGRILALGAHPVSELCSHLTDQLRQDISTATIPARVFDVTIVRLQAGDIPVDDMGINSGCILTIRDVTKERQTQERVRAQDRLAAMGELAAGIAHDFNNILASIILKAQLIKSYETSVTPRAKEYLNDIYQQSKRASDLVNQILDYSRASAFKSEPLNLTVLIGELRRLLDRLLPENIELQVSDDEREYMVEGDRTRLLQVLMNLALNARDAMPHGGNLKIALELVSLQRVKQEIVAMFTDTDVTTECWVCIRVSDTGSGIDANTLPHIFEPFFTTKAPGKGTGLGLAQVYGIIQQHKGYIGVQSTLEAGTTFTLFLPCANTPQGFEDQLGETWNPLLEPRRNGKIMLVEDDRLVRESIREVIKLAGYEVLETVNGKEALQCYDEHSLQIQAIITDLMMPVMGGLDLCRELRSRKYQSPILILSGYPAGLDMTQIKELNITQLIQKPVDAEVLISQLSKAIEGNFNAVQL